MTILLTGSVEGRDPVGRSPALKRESCNHHFFGCNLLSGPLRGGHRPLALVCASVTPTQNKLNKVWTGPPFIMGDAWFMILPPTSSKLLLFATKISNFPGALTHGGTQPPKIPSSYPRQLLSARIWYLIINPGHMCYISGSPGGQQLLPASLRHTVNNPSGVD